MCTYNVAPGCWWTVVREVEGAQPRARPQHRVQPPPRPILLSYQAYTIRLKW